jgi:hypothetical protein
MQLKLPSMSQVYAGLRYAGTAAGTLGTIGVLIGLLPQDQSAALVASFQQVVADIVQLFNDTTKFVLLAIPVGTLVIAKIGWNSASLAKQTAAVQALPTTQVSTTDPNLAAAVPGVKLVAKLP